MALTVIQAFNEFMREQVDLEPSNVTQAKNSRSWLLEKIETFPKNDFSFPSLYSEKNIFFGSFSRGTKKKPLDDIDIMIALWADSSTYFENASSTTIEVTNPNSRLKKLCFDGTNNLNSIKVVNKIVSSLKEIPQYSRSDIKRNQEAAVLRLNSYDWDFDIIPCFFTSADSLGRTFYLIPDGKGSWKKTDPRIDHNLCKTIDDKHDNNVRRLIRIMKYWNKRPTMPSMGSYLLETLILNYYKSKHYTTSEFVDLEIPSLLEYIGTHILSDVQDPKAIQGNINSLDIEERIKIAIRANIDKTKADAARSYESATELKASINKWRDIFGEGFPKHG